MKLATNTILLAFFLFGAAQADTEYLECDNCTESEYRELARAHQPADPSSSEFDVYVADVEREILRRYRVLQENEPGMPLRIAVRRPAAAAELASFTAYIEVRNQLIAELDALDFSVEIPPGHFVGSAYDLWGSNLNRLLVREFINAELSFLELAFSEFFATGSFLLDRSASRIFVQVRFPDGSVAYFELAGKMQDLIWVYLEGQSIDANGNTIPDSLPDFAGFAGLFDAASVQDFLVRAALYNIPVTNEGAGSALLAVVCVEDAHGEYSCIVSSAN